MAEQKPVKRESQHRVNLPNREREKGISVFILGLVLSFMLALPVGYGENDVRIKILAVNPSSTDTIMASIHQVLPPELTPEDVTDKAGMEIAFDKTSQTYALTKEVELQPKETKTLVVTVKNVWKVSDEMIEKVRGDLEANVKALQGTKYEASSQLLYQKVSDQIGEIELAQTKSVGVQRQVELYRAHVKQIEQIHRDVISINSMRQMVDEETGGVRTIKFVIQAENPDADAKRMRVEAFLPENITAEDILDKLDFAMLYDEDRNRFGLYKEYDFQPKEKKTFEITIRDIWYIPKTELEHLEGQTKKILQRFEGSNFESYAKQSGDFIYSALESIDKLQNEVGESPNIEDRIRAFTLNSERIVLVKEKIKELQDLMLEVPLKRELDEFEKIRQAVKELSKVIDILRLGFTPDLSTTWWLILGIMAFLFVMSASFYITWLTKLNDNQFKAKNSAKAKKEEAATVSMPESPPEGANNQKAA